MNSETPSPTPIRRFQIQLIDLFVWLIYLGAIMLVVPVDMLRKSGLNSSQLFTLLFLFLTPIPVIAIFGVGISNARRWNSARRILFWMVLMIPLAGVHYAIAGKLARFAVQQNLFNETKTVYTICKGFSDLQETYRKTDWDHDGVLEYASSLKQLRDAGLIPPEFAAAEGSQGIPYHGYLFKIITAQGSSGPNGTKNYFEGSHLTKGVALLAVPTFDPDLIEPGTVWAFCWMFDARGAEIRHPIDFADPRAFLNSIERLEYKGYGWELVW